MSYVNDAQEEYHPYAATQKKLKIYVWARQTFKIHYKKSAHPNVQAET